MNARVSIVSLQVCRSALYLPITVVLSVNLPGVDKGLYSGVTQIDVSKTVRHYVEHGEIFLQPLQGL